MSNGGRMLRQRRPCSLRSLCVQAHSPTRLLSRVARVGPYGLRAPVDALPAKQQLRLRIDRFQSKRKKKDSESINRLTVRFNLSPFLCIKRNPYLLELLTLTSHPYPFVQRDQRFAQHQNDRD